MVSPRTSAEIGRVLGDRYRIIAPIGRGASAQVYLADDERLRRRVALKMLHDALADDAEFLRRFRAEARAAAALSHPNVMAVYDWGDDGIAFIVTEYLGGGSLRGLLDAGHLLTTSQALSMGLEATRALDYAHRRGFVHRDIKPANLLFGEDQRLRIADFGLARALAEAAWTEPQGAMLGTARYASPEQAKGEKLDGKADVYALALVIIEAVTGQVPFASDTTLGTLMARVGHQLEVPEELGPLADILARAGHPDPEQRIDARKLAAGLLRAAKALARPAALPLAGALDPEAAMVADKDPSVHAPVTDPDAPAVNLNAGDLNLDPPDWVSQAEPVTGPLTGAAPVVVSGLGHQAATPAATVPTSPPEAIDPEPTPEVVELLDGAEDRSVDTESLDAGVIDAGSQDESDVEDPPTTDQTPVIGALAAPSARQASNDRPARMAGPLQLGPAAATDPEDTDPDDVEPGERRRRRWPWVLLVLVLIAGVGGAAAALLIDRDPAPVVPAVQLPVPALTNRSQATAESVAAGAGWKTRVTTERRDGTIVGQVLASTPPAGTRLKAGETIVLVVSAGQTEVEVPTDLIGLSLPDATAALEAVGLEVESGDTRFDEEVAKGSVLEVAEGTPERIEKGATVEVVLSDGPEPRTVPSGIVGSDEDAATATLTAAGLEVAIDRRFNDEVDAGDVVSQRPRPGERVERGTTVTIEVSRGPALVAVPDVSGADSPAGAAALLRQAGLVPGKVSGSSEGAPSTDPASGTEVEKGSTVDIILR